jgi:O-antigen ligase
MKIIPGDTAVSPWSALPGWALCAGLLFSLISISLAEGFLFLAVVLWAAWLIKDKVKFSAPAFFIPLLAYAGISLVSSAFSVNPEVSFKDCRELALYLIVPLTFMSLRTLEDIRRANLAVFASAAASLVYSFYRFAAVAPPGERIKGFMGHYMTQAGLLVMFVSLALAVFVFGRKKSRFLWGTAALAAGVALEMTLTRSAWIGLAAAVCILVFIRNPKLLIAVPVAVALVFFASPAPVKQRVLSIFKLQGFSNRTRVEYIRAGVKIIGDYPLTGTGPDTVDMVFQNPKYGLSEDAKRNVHLHNTVIQIAAERGIPALAAWLVFIVAIFLGLAKLVRARDPETLPLAAGALAALTAIVVSGFFEYNFGDSEVAILFFYLVTMPFAAAGARRAEARSGGQNRC